MRRLANLVWWCAVGVVLAPAAARASAWRAPEGGQLIVTLGGGLNEGSAFIEGDTYLEENITSRIGLVSTPRVESVLVIDPTTGALSSTERSDLFIGAKVSLHEGKRLALAVQAGPTWNSKPSAQCSEFGGEARVLVGGSIGQVFTDAEFAYRVESDQCRNGKIDLTAGWKLGEHWMGLAQTFIDDDSVSSPAVKLQMSLIRFNQDGAGLQIGFRVRPDSEGEGERALVVGWWRAPHKSVTPSE